MESDTWFRNTVSERRTVTSEKTTIQYSITIMRNRKNTTEV